MLKLVADLEKKKQFLLANEEFFLNLVSLRFGFTYNQMLQYSDIISWSYLVTSHAINWNTIIIDNFENEIFSVDEGYSGINLNDSLPWSIELLERYEHLWNWEMLSQNRKVMSNLEIRNHFYNRLYPYIEEIGENNTYMYTGINGSERTITDTVEQDFENMELHTELQFQTKDEILNAEVIDWFYLSQNVLLPWSSELIEQFSDHWNWSKLSTNRSIPWDLELIHKFESNLDWTKDSTDENGATLLNRLSISANSAIKWDDLLLSKFVTKLNTWDISLSESVKWDIDLLIRFGDFWEYEILTINNTMWKKVFSEFDEERNLFPLLDILMKE